MAKYLIARAKITDPETGKEIPVDVRTRAEAVVCDDDRNAQEHFNDIIKHMADGTLHPSVTKQAEWDAKESPAGAQQKANAARDAAVARATTLATNAKEAAIAAASIDATIKATNAKHDAISAAAADTTKKFAAFRVGSSQLADGAVATSKLADGAVTGDKIEDGAVTLGKLAKNSVGTEKILDYSVTTRKIENGSVTKDKLAADIAPADFVTKTGTSGGWTFRKWKSGTIEAWAEFSETVNLEKVFGITTDAGTRALVRGMFAEKEIPAAIGFSAKPVINVSIDSAVPAWVSCDGSPSSANKTPGLEVMAWSSGSSINSVAMNLKFFCIGK